MIYQVQILNGRQHLLLSKAFPDREEAIKFADMLSSAFIAGQPRRIIVRELRTTPADVQALDIIHAIAM